MSFITFGTSFDEMYEKYENIFIQKKISTEKITDLLKEERLQNLYHEYGI